MLTGAALQSLVLAAVCLSSRAVPLRNITSSEEEDRRLTTESNPPSPSVFNPEISSERPHSSSFSSRVHDGLGSVTAVDDEDRTLRWNSSYHTQTADGQPDKPLPEESLNASLSPTAEPFITENSESSHERRREDNAPEPEDTTSVNISSGSAVRLHQTLNSRDVWTEALHLLRGQ